MHQNGIKVASKKYGGKKELKLNLGCGHTHKPGWVNIDFYPDSDVNLDLREALPFDDDSCSSIYSEHFFEHISYPEETTVFLAESLRSMRSGGVFRVGVPDTEWCLTAYTDENSEYWKHAKNTWHPWCTTKLHHINFHFRQGQEHKYAYDFETMKDVLEKAGFTNVTNSEFDPEKDSEVRRLGTLYVNCEKP